MIHIFKFKCFFRKSAALFCFLALIILALPFLSAAHFMVGFVNNASDGTSPDGLTVVLWNPANGIADNLTDVVGPTGNSGTSNFYLIDCELLNSPCQVNDEMRAMMLNDGGNYVSLNVSANVTGAGFDTMPNITLNSPPSFVNLSVNDAITSPIGEVDLTPASTREVICEGIVSDLDGNATITSVSSEIFATASSSYGGGDDNNEHYTNSSCNIDYGIGDDNQAYFSCSFGIEYYADSGNWNCTVAAQDNLSITGLGTNNTNVNELLALTVPSPINFGIVNGSDVSNENQINVTNSGNTQFNLSLSGYGMSEGDNLSMNCSLQGNFSVGYTSYNLTDSNPGDLTLSQFETFYKNLTANPIVNTFDLPQRVNDTLDDVNNATYWRIYVPLGVSGDCSGNIIFGAVQAPE